MEQYSAFSSKIPSIDTLPYFLLSNCIWSRYTSLVQWWEKLRKSCIDASFAAKKIHFSCSENHSRAMVFCHHARMQICHDRRELQFQLLVTAVHRNHFLFHSPSCQTAFATWSYYAIPSLACHQNIPHVLGDYVLHFSAHFRASKGSPNSLLYFLLPRVVPLRYTLEAALVLQWNLPFQYRLTEII